MKELCSGLGKGPEKASRGDAMIANGARGQVKRRGSVPPGELPVMVVPKRPLPLFSNSGEGSEGCPVTFLSRLDHGFLRVGLPKWRPGLRMIRKLALCGFDGGRLTVTPQTDPKALRTRKNDS